MVKSKVRNKEYDPTNVVYITKLNQYVKYMANGADSYLVDIYYDPNLRSDYREKMVYVFEKNDVTAALKKQWDERTLHAD